LYFGVSNDELARWYNQHPDSGRNPHPHLTRLNAGVVDSLTAIARKRCRRDVTARVWTRRDDYAHANHPPNVVVNGVGGKSVLSINAVAGQPVALSAAGSSDPDGNQLQFQWIAYNEAGYRPILQQNPTATASAAANLSMTVTANSSGIFHVILAVTDNGTPNLTSYRRIILNVTQ
jgi:hypothetical protein